MTSMSRLMPNSLYVSLRRLELTAVTASLWLIANEMTGSKLGSFPSKVMSVPCNVVITGRSTPLCLRICFAVYALDACGIA